MLLLDQFPRQIWSDTGMAFAGDPQALALSLKAVERGWLEAEPEQARRQFWLMPLFERFSDPRTADFARRHRDVVARFGRFPHRNALLGRVSSAEKPSGPWVAGRWPVLTQMVQPDSLQGRCTLPGGLRSQHPPPYPRHWRGGPGQGVAVEHGALAEVGMELHGVDSAQPGDNAAGHHLPEGHLQALAPAFVTPWPEVQHLVVGPTLAWWPGPRADEGGHIFPGVRRGCPCWHP